ncbi:hypothetical protein PseudUWO311_01045 [Pseudanabaena sp. UWO311]|uniref:hypothetical protein n=1 Tax=Pseudanabaena sp. UWO311 TaxID=2487337 RepID=UPI001159FC1C|nr:hypothetical protein [Pseudanabaena sp. UWO311]TYQ29514.1 hypothetical protein PseudUWO311_01045 [Pseudanabaena sp. UWO311]
MTKILIILGQLSDNILLIARLGIVDSLNAVFVKAMIEKSGQSIMGLVINGVLPNHDPESKKYFDNAYYKDKISLNSNATNTTNESPQADSSEFSNI